MQSISHGASCLIIFPGVIHEILRYALDSFWRFSRQKLDRGVCTGIHCQRSFFSGRKSEMRVSSLLCSLEDRC